MQGRLAIIGAGSWGTTLARLLALNGWELTIHCVPETIATGINRLHHNPLYFAQIELPSAIRGCSNLAEALSGCATAYLAVPGRYLREFFAAHLDELTAWAANSPEPAVLCNCTKGLLTGPTERTGAFLERSLKGAEHVHLAGPNLAAEVMAGQPAAAVAAGAQWAAQRIQQQLICDNYRVYTGSDKLGVEVAGFYKNIIAIAAGAVSGLGLGDNTRAALVTRGLAEMGRLSAYFGGEARTLFGLAGVGDLIVTAGSPLSRNFQVGQRRAQGQPLSQILAEMHEVAEGIQASEAVHCWPAEHGLSGWPELPIAEAVYRFVHQGGEAEGGIVELMRRPPKAE